MVTDIPLTQLKKGFLVGVNHIQEMLDSSKTLLDTGHYTMSISISILTLEEITKFNKISTHIRKRKPISKEEWKELSKPGSHNAKITKVFEYAHDQVIEMGEEHHERVQELSKKLDESDRLDFETISKKIDIQQLENLNIIKKECIYLDWKENDWNTFEISFIAKGQAAFAEVLFYQNLGIFLAIMLENTNPVVSLDEQSQKFKAYQNNPFMVQLEKIKKIERTNEFKEKIAIAQAILKDYSK